MRIKIRNFRGIKNLEIDISDGITIIIGKNDSGKSSLLEAIYLGFTAFNGFKGSFIEYLSPAYLLMRRNTKIHSLVFYGEKFAEISIALNKWRYNVRISDDLNALNLDSAVYNELNQKLREVSTKSIEAMRSYNALIKFFTGMF